MTDAAVMIDELPALRVAIMNDDDYAASCKESTLHCPAYAQSHFATEVLTYWPSISDELPHFGHRRKNLKQTRP
jgi:hypothetical protein